MTYAKLLRMAAFQPRVIDNEIAELYAGGESMLNDLRQMGLKPIKERRGALSFDREDIDTFIDKAKQEGIWQPKIEKNGSN